MHKQNNGIQWGMGIMQNCRMRKYREQHNTSAKYNRNLDPKAHSNLNH